MKRKTIIISLIIASLILSNGFMLYYFLIRKEKTENVNKKSELYVCPMHPQIQQDHPGTCPICNMELVLKGSNEKMESKEESSPNTKYGEIVLSPSQQVIANVKTQVVEYSEFDYSIEANGVIKLRDDASRQISSPIKGKITRLYINYEGQKVRKGQKVFEIYSPELIATQKEFLLAYENYLRTQESPNLAIKESAQSLLNAAKQRLLLWFVDENQINELMETKQIKNSIAYYSDFSGVVTKKYFNEGSWVMEGNTILDIVNLSSVWVMADIYENEISKIRIGQQAKIKLEGYKDKELIGKIDYINPFVNEDTRTIEVRITVPNPVLILKPGMYVKVQIKTEKKTNSIVIPKTAVLRLGKMDIVYVKKSDNIFAPRQVEIGGEKDGKILIKSGLEKGEIVVVSGGFLLDSESQIRLGSGSNMENMPGMDMPEKENNMEIKGNDALKEIKQHRH